uniref:Epithiospecifier modifier n=1 Tax=Brassica rapa subsp. pekinensis TaxID=51351 RepID=C1KH67_BRARP|nr:epithiospecifier modifier [Brassica rapa subsp. pekinensis]ACO57706.1 epithiospecifier modifier [Brassica rapa subsp. pekinensis]
MACKFSFVSVMGVLLVLTIFHDPIIVDAGQGVPEVALFTFGDSYYDAGNKAFLGKNKNPPQNLWPYGKSRDDPNGKFSDGYIVPDFIAEFMSIPNGIPPALKPGANLSRGASFAVADASILGAPVESMTLNQQVNKFRSMISTWSEDYIEKSLFMIYIGTEDYLNFTKFNPTASASAQQAFVTSVTNKLKTDIGLLYSLGASKFAVPMLAPLGCLPIVRQEYKTGNDCYEPLNDLAKQHNEKIGPILNEYAKKPNGGFQFTVLDFYNAVIRRTTRSCNYRFYVANSSCCGVGTHNAYGCGMANVHSKLCEYQRSYFFFDGRHNTEKAQEEIAHLLYGANTNVIHPMTVRELIVFPAKENMRELWEPNTSIRRRRSSRDYLDLSAYY